MAFHAFHVVFGWPRGRVVTPRYNQWLDDVEGIASVFQGCPKIAETRNVRRACWAMSNFWTTFCFCWLIFAFPRDILERMKLILHYFWLRYLPRESEKFANLALFRAFPSLALRGLTFGLNSANQRLCFDWIFLFFKYCKELLSPSWKKVSPIESVLPVWFCFEREKKDHFQIRPEVINFAYVLECSVVHQDVVARLALWRVLKGVGGEVFQDWALWIQIYAKMIWTSFSTLKRGPPLATHSPLGRNIVVRNYEEENFLDEEQDVL